MHNRINIEDKIEEDYNWIDRILDSQKPMTLVCSHLASVQFKPPASKIAKWQEDLQVDLREDEHSERARNSTINSKLLSFNYNFLTRNVPYAPTARK